MKRRKSALQLGTWAIALLLVGLFPLISNILAVLIGDLLGCLVIEHGAYTKLEPPEEFYGTNLRPGCSVGGTEVGPALHFMLRMGLGIAFTWPAVLAALMIGLTLLVRVLRSRPSGNSRRP